MNWDDLAFHLRIAWINATQRYRLWKLRRKVRKALEARWEVPVGKRYGRCFGKEWNEEA